jgi:hypothetical protein
MSLGVVMANMTTVQKEQYKIEIGSVLEVQLQ